MALIDIFIYHQKQMNKILILVLFACIALSDVIPDSDIIQSESHGRNYYDFQWQLKNTNMKATRVIIRSGAWIDSVQFIFSDGVDYEVSPEFGGDGGGIAAWDVPDGEEIVEVQYTTGIYVYSLVFVTDKGTRSPKFGGQGTRSHTQRFPQGFHIIGMHGFQGLWIDRLGFILAKRGQVRETQGQGAAIPNPFSWQVNDPNMNLKQVLIRSGQYVNSIQLMFSNGFRDVYSPIFGGPGGSLTVWNVPEFQYIAQVDYTSGTVIDSLTFITNSGTRSPRFGQGTGGPHSEEFPIGYKIIGIHGFYGSWLESLGFILTESTLF